MVIVRPDGGIANQMNLYALGRYLAYKLNTELKMINAPMRSIARAYKFCGD